MRVLYLQQLPALGKCSVFISGVNGVKLTQYPDPCGETESIMVLCLKPLTLSSYNKQFSSSSLHQEHVLQFLI